jgi:hypothetical protein
MPMDDGLNHPADRLALVRQRIKTLQAEEAELKAACLALDATDRVGRYAEVCVADVSRTTIDTKALKEGLGEDVLAPFQRTTQSVVLTIKQMGAE